LPNRRQIRDSRYLVSSIAAVYGETSIAVKHTSTFREFSKRRNEALGR
jgi:hypothetical protein